MSKSEVDADRTLRWKLWPKQMRAFLTEATELLFGGASEGGKSHFVRIALCAWCLAIPELQCVLIRKKFSDILGNHVEGRTGFKSLLKPWIDAKEASVTQEGVKFKNGSNIIFQHCQDERQFDSAQGVEKHVLVFDEATQIGERLIRFFRTWCRMSLEMQATLPDEWKGKFPRIIYTANPIGPSVGFFRRRFVVARDPYEIEEIEGFKRQYIPSRYTDNLSVDEKAHKGRMAGIGDKAIAQALDNGDWESPTGDYFPEWDEDRHILPNFTPDPSWFRYRSYDWGTADPSVCYWWATSPGQLVHNRWIPRGALVCYRESYIAADDDPSIGRRLRNEEMRDGILERTEPEFRHQITLADSLPFQDRGGETIAEIFNNKGLGVRLTRADDSRVPGWSQLRARLQGVQPDTNSPFRYPMIYFVESCRAARDYLPALTRHPNEDKREDAQEHGEATHACDAIRYACMAHRVIRDAPTSNEDMVKKQLAQLGKRPTLKKIIKNLPI